MHTMQIDNQEEANKLLNIAAESIQQRNYQNASNICKTLNKEYPDLAEGWYLSSLLAIHTGAPKFSLETIDRALKIKPDNYYWILHKIHLLFNLGEQYKSLELAKQTTQAEINDASILEELGLFLSKTNAISESKKLFQKALLLSHDSDRLYFNLALAHNFLGEIDDAVLSCNRAININNHNYQAHFLRSGLTRQTPSDNHIQVLKDLLKENIKDPVGYTQICYALAKELEDCEDYRSSFVARKNGAEIYRKNINYEPDSDISFINKIIETYDHKLFNDTDNGYDNNEPIFILGLPRSGSTLVDRIISSHDKVHSAGELTNFTHQIINMMQQISVNKNLSRTDMVRLSSQLDFNHLGQSYIESTRPQTNNKPFFTDKFPQNALYIGPIQMALPNSRIILVQRHPLDICYAMYKQLFTGIYQFSYNLDELADYFIAHQKLIEHWLSLMPEKIHIIRYEDLVENIESETRKLLNFCNLEWQSQCLSYHKNKQSTATASASQVRQKLYKSSIGLWKNYEKELEPLITKLDNANMLHNWR